MNHYLLYYTGRCTLMIACNHGDDVRIPTSSPRRPRKLTSGIVTINRDLHAGIKVSYYVVPACWAIK